MARRLPSRILKHTARVAALRAGEQPGDPDPDVWVEGEPSTAGITEVVEESPAGEFAAILFLPTPGAEQSSDAVSWRPRTIVRPTLLYNLVAGVAMPAKDVELLIVAADLEPVTGPGPVRWQVEGEPQMFGPPGAATVGAQATLKRVVD